MNKIDFINKRPIRIFKVNNFLDTKFYEDLKLNFNFFDLTKFKEGKDGKMSLDSGDQYYKELYEKNDILKKFHNFVFSENFFKFFYKKLYFDYIISQKDDLLRLLKYLRPGLLDINKNKNFLDVLYSKIGINISYSIIYNQGFIAPHTDSIRKFLSLMLYFPDCQNGLDSGAEKKEETYGTTFWNSDIRNYSNNHVEEKNYKEFEKKSQKILVTPFKKNTLYGFIRNNKSWHSVEPKNIGKNYIRKSININFMYLN